MSTIIIFNEENRCLESHITADEITVLGSDILFGANSLKGIGAKFIVIDEDLEISEGEDISDQLQKDIKDRLISENEKIRQEISSTQAVLNELLLGGLGL